MVLRGCACSATNSGEATLSRKRSTWNVSGFTLALGSLGIVGFWVLIFFSEGYKCSTWNTPLYKLMGLHFSGNELSLISHFTPFTKFILDCLRSVSHDSFACLPLFTDLVRVVNMKAICVG